MAMMRRSLFTILVGVALAGAVLGGPLVSRADAGERFRAELLQFIQEMRVVAAALVKQGGPDQTASLDQAEQLVRSLSPEQLEILEAAFARSPNWREMPGVLDALITRKGAQRKMLERHRYAEAPARQTMRRVSAPLLTTSAAPWTVEKAVFPEGPSPWRGPWEVVPAITPNDCPAARAAGITATDVEIAADVAHAADAVLEAVPTDTLSLPVRIAAVAIWEVPQAVLRGFEHPFNIAENCDDDDHRALTVTNLDVAVSTRATQVSVNAVQNTLNTTVTNLTALQTSVNAVQASVNAASTLLSAVQAGVNNVQSSVNSVQSSVNTANTALTALQATADGIQTGVTGANTKLDTALTSLSTAQTKLDTLLAQTGGIPAFLELAVRMQIEANLSDEQNKIVALFALPAAQNGHLETTRAIVLEVIQMTRATGQFVGQALDFLAVGDRRAGQGQFKLAYEEYRKAYRTATRVPTQIGSR